MKKKVALVTGSSQGIGKGIAKKLLDENYIVYINGRDEEKLNKVQEEYSNENLRILKADLTYESIIKDSLNIIYKEEKSLDLVVANIGSGKSMPGWEVPLDEYRRVFDINFFNAVALSTVYIDLCKNEKGHIVFISSIAGCESLGAPITYSSAKTALLAYAKSLSNDVSKLNIRVNTISPGNVMFPGSTWEDKIQNNREFVEDYIKSNVPLNDFATPEDIGKTVLYLENCDFVTGSNIVVDGGQLNKII